MNEKMTEIKVGGCLLVIPRARLINALIQAGEYTEAVRRGKAIRRRRALQERMKKGGKNEINFGNM